MSAEVSRGIDAGKLAQRAALLVALGFGGNAMMTKETGAAEPKCAATVDGIRSDLLNRVEFGDEATKYAETCLPKKEIFKPDDRCTLYKTKENELVFDECHKGVTRYQSVWSRPRDNSQRLILERSQEGPHSQVIAYKPD